MLTTHGRSIACITRDRNYLLEVLTMGGSEPTGKTKTLKLTEDEFDVVLAELLRYRAQEASTEGGDLDPGKMKDFLERMGQMALDYLHQNARIRAVAAQAPPKEKSWEEAWDEVFG